MNLRLVALLTLAFVTACSGPPSPQPGATDPSRAGARAGTWRQAQTERKGQPLQWEMREDFSAAQRAAQPNLLVISAHYQPGKPGALPDAAQSHAFDAFEDSLLQAMKGKAELVAVMSGNEQHDWYFYSDSGEVLSAARALPPPSSEADLAVSVEADPQGEFYTKLQGKLQAH